MEEFINTVSTALYDWGQLIILIAALAISATRKFRGKTFLILFLACGIIIQAEYLFIREWLFNDVFNYDEINSWYFPLYRVLAFCQTLLLVGLAISAGISGRDTADNVVSSSKQSNTQRSAAQRRQTREQGLSHVFCKECGEKINHKAVICTHCGCEAGVALRRQTRKQGLSRVVYILLAWFFGLLGVHNFVAGRTGAAVTQLLITIFIGWTFVPLFIVGIWVICEMITVTESGDGTPFS
jgi:TM2 domain-containing membrane protein YozV